MPDFKTFLNILIESPEMWVAVLPITVLILVNGLTDAPVNIATAVNSGAISPRKAILMSAICNFSGAVASGGTVAASIYSISGLALVGESVLPALTASAIVVSAWAVFALWLGLPTSESHALSAALSGSAISIASFSEINYTEWCNLFLALLLSTLPVAVISYFTALFFKFRIKLYDSQYLKLQILGAAMSSFAHGSQDGQKFAGVLALSVSFYAGQSNSNTVPIWCMSLSAVLIFAGTLIGGRKILKTFGTFAPTTSTLGFAADFVSATVLCLLSVFGLPAATTCAKTSAVFGAGRVSENSPKALKTALKMVSAWLLTFPICGVFGYFLTKLLLLIEIF